MYTSNGHTHVCTQVHMSNVHAREDMKGTTGEAIRHHSVISNPNHNYNPNPSPGPNPNPNPSQVTRPLDVYALAAHAHKEVRSI